MSDNLAIDVVNVAKKILGDKFLRIEGGDHDCRFVWIDSDSPTGERSVTYPLILQSSQLSELSGFLEANIREPRYNEY